MLLVNSQLNYYPMLLIFLVDPCQPKLTWGWWFFSERYTHVKRIVHGHETQSLLRLIYFYRIGFDIFDKKSFIIRRLHLIFILNLTFLLFPNCWQTMKNFWLKAVETKVTCGSEVRNFLVFVNPCFEKIIFNKQKGDLRTPIFYNCGCNWESV